MIEGRRAEGRAKKKEHGEKEVGKMQERWGQEGKSLKGRWVWVHPWRGIRKREHSQEHGGLLHHSKRVGEDGEKKESLRIETAPEIFVSHV